MSKRCDRKSGLTFKRGKNLCGESRVWINLSGNSYVGTDDPQALADWLESVAVPWLRKQRIKP